MVTERRVYIHYIRTVGAVPVAGVALLFLHKVDGVAVTIARADFCGWCSSSLME